MPKHIVITGAGSGFGRGAALELARRGHTVTAATLTEAEADEMSAREGITGLRLDVTDAAERDQLRAIEMDVLINNAGMGQSGPVSRIPLDRLRRVFEVNVFGTVACSQIAAEQMVDRGSGRILIVSSIAGLIAGPMTGAYAMSKHALQAFGSALRAELAPQGVDVALINPGPFATGFNDRMVDEPGDWFDYDTASPSEVEQHRHARQRITVGQRDPEVMYGVYADLVEADTTELVNLVPPDIFEQMGIPR
jgi:NAD(P)-dependent dehydrogenase (short-subunit alcohol dehydrogenase family)